MLLGQIDCLHKYLILTKWKIAVVIEMNITGELFNNILKNRNRCSAILGKVLGSLEKTNPLEIHASAGNQITISGKYNLIKQFRVKKFYDCMTDQRYSAKWKQVFVRQPFTAGTSDNCGRESNHVSSFTLTIITAHQPYYKIGSLNPCDIIPIKPVKQNFNVDIDIIDYQTRSLHDYIKTGIHVKNLSVKMRDKCDPDKYCTFEFPNSYLVSENVSVDSQNNTKAKLSYECLTIDKPIINYYGFPDGS